MFTTLKNFFTLFNTSALHQECEELEREAFERHAFASGDFKGVRFTRLKDGKYADARLESEWREWLADQEWADRQI